MSNTQITACSKCVKSWMTGQNMDTASSHWPPEEQGKVYFWRPKAEIFHQSFTLCPMIMPSMNGSPYSSTQIFLCISILNISRATHCRSVLCQKADHPDVAQLSEKVWSALPIQLTNWRISWPWARSESLSPPSKTIGASWEMVVARTSTFHWSWCRKVQAVWVHGSLSQEINAVVRRIILNLEESCGAVQLWNPSEHLEFAADWQIGRTRLWFWRRRLMP